MDREGILRVSLMMRRYFKAEEISVLSEQSVILFTRDKSSTYSCVCVCALLTLSRTLLLSRPFLGLQFSIIHAKKGARLVSKLAKGELKTRHLSSSFPLVTVEFVFYF